MTGNSIQTSPNDTLVSGARPAASVVVLNYNGERYLNGCLAALARQEVDGGFEVLLADNGSTDGSIERVRRDHQWVRVVEIGRNRGFSGGNNVAFRAAAGRHMVVLNNDTMVQPGWLAALVAAADSDERVGAVTSKLVFADRPDVIQNAGLLLLSDGGGADRGSGERDVGQYGRREEVFGFCGGAALLRRDMLKDVGGFDETFFAYYEDADLSWRMRLRGWSVLYEPAAVVQHVHSATNVDGSSFFLFHADRNRLFLLVKNASPRLALRCLKALRNTVADHRSASTAAAELIVSRPLRRVALSLCLHLPEMMWKRLAIRRRSRVADQEIERWLYPRSEWDARFA
jgi:GT2 family glycosyltransferase